VLEADAQRAVGQPVRLPGQRRVPDVGLGVDDVEHPAEAGEGVLRLVEHLAGGLHGRDEQRDEEEEGDQGAGRDLPRQAEQHPDDDDRGVGDRSDELAAHEDRRRHLLGVDGGPVVPVDGGVDAVRRPVAHPVGPHGRGADDGLRHRSEHVAHPLADHSVGGGQPLREPADGEPQRHEARQHQQGQLPGVDRHHDRGDDELTEADQAEHAAPLHEHRQLVDVAGHAGDQRAAPLALLVQDRQVVHVPERPHPQAGQRGLGGAEQPHVHAEDGDGRDHHDDGADQDQLGDQTHVGPVRPGQPAVDDLLDGDGHDHAAGGGDQREGEGGRQAAAELGHHPQPAAQRGERPLVATVAGQQHVVVGAAAQAGAGHTPTSE
jgi:hypothetical protein